MVNDLGMSWKSHHVLGAPFKLPAGTKPPTDAEGKPIKFPPMRNLKENMQELVDEVAEGGVPYLVCANTPVETLDEIKSSIEVLNKTGEACKKAGIQFAYHNHDREFYKVEEQVPYHLILSQTDADKVKMELDLCWVTKAGVDPVELFKQHPGRFPLWHVKDIDKDMKGPQPVGTGIIDFKRIFVNSGTAGMQHFFVEHDMPADPFASITTSYNNLQKILQA
jgi:sugar phosphate isomerase/epimerase